MKILRTNQKDPAKVRYSVAELQKIFSSEQWQNEIPYFGSPFPYIEFLKDRKKVEAILRD